MNKRSKISIMAVAALGAASASAIGSGVAFEDSGLPAGAQHIADGAKPSPSAFGELKSRAQGRTVPITRTPGFADAGQARVVGVDPQSDGQEYAVSYGATGICLVAIPNDKSPGFEACTPYSAPELRATSVIGDGRLRVVSVSADASRAGQLGRVVAPGLTIRETKGELPGEAKG